LRSTTSSGHGTLAVRFTTASRHSILLAFSSQLVTEDTTQIRNNDRNKRQRPSKHTTMPQRCSSQAFQAHHSVAQSQSSVWIVKGSGGYGYGYGNSYYLLRFDITITL